MAGTAPAAGGSGGGAGSSRAPGGDTPAARKTRLTSRDSAAAEGVEVTYDNHIPVPAPARPWFLLDNDEEKVHVMVHGRLPDGSTKPHNVTLHRRSTSWRLTGIMPLVNDLDVHRGDRVRLTREAVAAAASGGAADGSELGVVVQKAAGLQQEQQGQQQQHRRRHVRTAVHIDPPLDPAGPSAGRVVVSRGRQFHRGSTIFLTRSIIPCLLDGAQVNEVMAAAASNGGPTPKYAVTVYARRAGDDGPPVPFQGVALTPSLHSTRPEAIKWCLSGLGALRQHLGLVPGSPVLLLREVGQDGRVRLVVEPWQEGGGGRGVEREGGAKEGEVKGKRSAGAEVEESGTEDEQGLLLGDNTSSGSGAGEGSEAGGSDEEGGSSSSKGGGTGSDDPNWVPGGGKRHSSGGARRAQPQPPQLPSQPLLLQQQQPEQQAQHSQPPRQQLAEPKAQPQQLQQPQQQSKSGADGGGGGGGGDVAGPSGAVGVGGSGVGGLGLGRAREGPEAGVEGRLVKRRRLQVSAALPEERLAAVWQHGPAAEGGGVAEAGGERGDNDLLHSGADLLLAALEASRAALAAAQTRVAALAADKAALEGQLGREVEAREAAEALRGREREAAQQQLNRERDRAEAAEAQLHCARQHMAGVLRRAGVADGRGPAAE